MLGGITWPEKINTTPYDQSPAMVEYRGRTAAMRRTAALKAMDKELKKLARPDAADLEGGETWV